VASLTGLEDEEKYKARGLLKDVKDRYEKPIQTSRGTQGRYVEPICNFIDPENENVNEPRMVLLCVPCFQLARLSGQNPSQRPHTHQVRTLLQYSIVIHPRVETYSKQYATSRTRSTGIVFMFFTYGALFSETVGSRTSDQEKYW